MIIREFDTRRIIFAKITKPCPRITLRFKRHLGIPICPHKITNKRNVSFSPSVTFSGILEFYIFPNLRFTQFTHFQLTIPTLTAFSQPIKLITHFYKIIMIILISLTISTSFIFIEYPVLSFIT